MGPGRVTSLLSTKQMPNMFHGLAIHKCHCGGDPLRGRASSAILDHLTRFGEDEQEKWKGTNGRKRGIKIAGLGKGRKDGVGRNIPARLDLFIYSFIQFTAIKSNQKQHNDKRQYS